MHSPTNHTQRYADVYSIVYSNKPFDHKAAKGSGIPAPQLILTGFSFMPLPLCPGDDKRLKRNRNWALLNL